MLEIQLQSIKLRHQSMQLRQQTRQLERRIADTRKLIEESHKHLAAFEHKYRIKNSPDRFSEKKNDYF